MAFSDEYIVKPKIVSHNVTVTWLIHSRIAATHATAHTWCARYQWYHFKSVVIHNVRVCIMFIWIHSIRHRKSKIWLFYCDLLHVKVLESTNFNLILMRELTFLSLYTGVVFEVKNKWVIHSHSGKLVDVNMSLGELQTSHTCTILPWMSWRGSNRSYLHHACTIES